MRTQVTLYARGALCETNYSQHSVSGTCRHALNEHSDARPKLRHVISESRVA